MKDTQYLWILITSVLLLLYVLTYYNGLKHTSVINATAILSLGAPITAILSWAFANGKILPMDALGMFVMIAGISILMMYSKNVNPVGIEH